MKFLVVDDDALVAKALARMLKPHDVEVMNSGKAAVEAIRNGRYELIFCDLNMPIISGRQLFREACEISQDLADRFVFVTGGTAEPETQEFLAQHRVLYKPFSRKTLRTLIDSL